MLKIITLVCVLIALLTAILTEGWLRSKRGHDEYAGRIFSILSSRYRSFRRFEYMPQAVAVVILGIAVGVGTDWKRAAVYAAGALLSCLAVTIGAGSHVTGVSAASHLAEAGDIRSSLKASYRSGSIMGFTLAAAGLGALGALFLFFNTRSAITISIYLALGVSTVSFVQSVGGNVYTSAYSVAKDDRDPLDNTGTYAGYGADLIETYVMAAVSCMVMADIGVDTSVVTSTFNLSSAAKFILIVYAAGIASSVIGSFFYGGRHNLGNKRRNSSGGATVGTIITFIITAVITLYMSFNMLQSRVYGWACITGMAAVIVLAEISKIYSHDGMIHIGSLKADRKLGYHSPVIFNLGSGMISLVFTGTIITAAVIVSYNLASYYGMALCAAGFAAALPSVSAVNGLALTAGAASSITDTMIEGDDHKVIADAIETISIRADVCARSYASTGGMLGAIALVTGIAHASGVQNINLISPVVIVGMICGAASAFVLMGLVIIAVRMTGRAALGNLGIADDDNDPAGFIFGASIPDIAAAAFPTVIGLLLGTDALTGFLMTASLTGFVLMAALDNAGHYYDRAASRALGSLIKFMLIFSAAFLPAFIRIGGFII